MRTKTFIVFLGFAVFANVFALDNQHEKVNSGFPGVQPPECENFWKYACEQSNLPIIRELNAAQKEAKLRGSEVREKYIKLMKIGNVRDALLKSDTLLNPDLEITNNNYVQFATEKGREKLIHHFINDFCANPIHVHTVLNSYSADLLDTVYFFVKSKMGLSQEVAAARWGVFPLADHRKSNTVPTELELKQIKLLLLDYNAVVSSEEYKKEQRKTYEEVLTFLQNENDPAKLEKFKAHDGRIYLKPETGLIGMITNIVEHILKQEDSEISLQLSRNANFKQDLAKIVYSDDFKSRVTNVFESARDHIHKVMAERKISHPTEASVSAKIEFPTKVTDFDILNGGAGAAYNTQTQKSWIEIGASHSQNEFSLFFMSAHELGHILSYHEKDRAQYKQVRNRLENCLQDPLSAGVEKNKLEESQADWWATEALVSYIKNHIPELTDQQKREAVAGSISTCMSVDSYYIRDKYSPDPHPPWDLRVNRITLAHPYFRSLFHCPAESGPKYCSGN